MNIEVRQLREVIVYKRLKTVESHQNDSPKKQGVIAYKRWSYTRGSKCKVLTGKNFVLWIGGRLWLVVPHAGSSIVITCTLTGRNSIFCSSQYGKLDNPNL